MDWGESQLELNFAIEHIAQLTENNADFSEEEWEVVMNFIEKIVGSTDVKYQEFPRKFKPIFLEKICKIIIYSALEQSFPSLIESNKMYTTWKFDLDTKFKNIEKVIEN